MSDNPIFDNIGNEPEHDRLEGFEKMEAKHDDTGRWITSLAGRKYIYGVASAVLVVAAAYFGIDAVTQENWLALAGAVLNLGGAGATVLAGKNVR